MQVRVQNYGAIPRVDQLFVFPLLQEIMFISGSEDENFYCLHAGSGSLGWIDGTESPIESSPAIWNGAVYVGNDGGNFYCFNDTNGNLIWNYTLSGPVSYSSPAVVNGYVYIGSFGDKLLCLNASWVSKYGIFQWEILIHRPLLREAMFT